MLFLHFGLLIWAAFIAWACFFQTGGNTAALKSTIVCNIFGAFLAWVAAIAILGFPHAALSLPVWAGIMVGLTVLVLCLASQVPGAVIDSRERLRLRCRVCLFAADSRRDVARQAAVCNHGKRVRDRRDLHDHRCVLRTRVGEDGRRAHGEGDGLTGCA